MHTQVISGNRGTWIFEKEHHAVTVFVPSESPTKEECSQLADHISGQTAIPFRLVLFPISSWDRDLTPWPAAPWGWKHCFRERSTEPCRALPGDFAVPAGTLLCRRRFCPLC